MLESISSRDRLRRDLPITTAALLMRTVGVPSYKSVLVPILILRTNLTLQKTQKLTSFSISSATFLTCFLSPTSHR